MIYNIFILYAFNILMVYYIIRIYKLTKKQEIELASKYCTSAGNYIRCN